MFRNTIAYLSLTIVLAACSDEPTRPELPSESTLSFTAGGLNAFNANGAQDPGNVLASSFAIAFADSLQGLVAIGYSPTGNNVGDVLILQFPRQTGSYSCSQTSPCHGTLLTGVRLVEQDGLTLWTSEHAYGIQSGSVIASEVGPSNLRGSFQATLRSLYNDELMQINDGLINVQYDSTPPAPGESMRGIECLLQLAAGQQTSCS